MFHFPFNLVTKHGQLKKLFTCLRRATEVQKQVSVLPCSETSKALLILQEIHHLQ